MVRALSLCCVRASVSSRWHADLPAVAKVFSNINFGMSGQIPNPVAKD